jgi:hypothetical protein
MASPGRAVTNSDSAERDATYRLLGIGTAGDWSVQIDGTPQEDAWGLTIDHPRLYVQALIGSIEVVRQFASALANPGSRSHKVRLGALFGAQFTALVSSRHLKFKLDTDRLDSDARHPDIIEVVFDPSEGARLLEALNGLIEDLPQAPPPE